MKYWSAHSSQLWVVTLQVELMIFMSMRILCFIHVVHLRAELLSYSFSHPLETLSGIKQFMRIKTTFAEGILQWITYLSF